MSPYWYKWLNEQTEEKKYVSHTEEPQILYVEHDSPPWSDILPKRAVCGGGQRSVPAYRQTTVCLSIRQEMDDLDGFQFLASVHCATINIHVQVFYFNLFYWHIVENIVLISAIQHRGSVILTQILLHILFHYGLWQDIEYSALCYTVGPGCLSIPYTIVCIC